jgi:hypothetical protein
MLEDHELGDLLALWCCISETTLDKREACLLLITEAAELTP